MMSVTGRGGLMDLQRSHDHRAESSHDGHQDQLTKNSHANVKLTEISANDLIGQTVYGNPQTDYVKCLYCCYFPYSEK